MAVEAFKSTEMTDGYRGKPTNDHGKLRIQYFHLPAVSVAGDIGTTVELCRLPSGPVRIIPDLSRIATTAFGASRTLDVGHRAYTKVGAPATNEAEDDNAFIDNLDVSSAVTGTAFGAGLSAFGYKLAWDLFSTDGVQLYATVAGGTIPINGAIQGFVVYVHE